MIDFLIGCALGYLIGKGVMWAAWRHEACKADRSAEALRKILGKQEPPKARPISLRYCECYLPITVGGQCVKCGGEV